MPQKIKWQCHKMSSVIKNYKNIKFGPALEDDKEVLKWIVENANGFSKREIRYASQGVVLGLFPLALYWVLNCKKSMKK